MTLNDIFNKHGDFKKKSYDPYRRDEKYQEMHSFLFDEDGDMNHDLWCSGKVENFINENGCGPFSDIVKFHWSQQMGVNTKGSYPAIYMWR